MVSTSCLGPVLSFLNCHRGLDSRVRSLNAQLARKHQRYAQIELKGSLAGKRFKKQLQEKAALPGEFTTLPVSVIEE